MSSAVEKSMAILEHLARFPEGAQVSLEAADGKMQVNAGRARFNLQTLPRDDFPVIAEGDLPTRFELPAATLRQVIDKTRFAISSEETRYYLMGIFFHVDGDAPRRRGASQHGSCFQRTLRAALQERSALAGLR